MIKKKAIYEFENLIHVALTNWYVKECKFPESEADTMVYNLIIKLKQDCEVSFHEQ